MQQELDRLKEDLREKRNEVLRSDDIERINRIIEHVEGIWGDCNCRPPYPFPPHDHTHCLRAEEKLYDLIPIEKMQDEHDGLSKDENFLLLSSIWLHDIGMCPKLFEKDRSDFRDPKDTEDWDKSVREKHAERSAEYIKEKGSELRLARDEIDCLIKMCLFHRHKAYEELYSLEWLSKEKIRLPLLIAYLRLADALHIPYKADVKEFKIYISLGMDPISRFHWFKSKYAEYVKVYPDKFTIEIILKRPQSISEEKIKPLSDIICLEVQDELDSIKDILSKGGISLFITVKCNSEVVLNMSENDETQLNELLSNIQLFDPTLTPSASSVIDNALSQIQMLIVTPDSKEAIKYLNDYRRNILADILKKRPCYVLLKKVEQLLDNTLNSDKDEQAIINYISESIDLCTRKRKNANSEIPKIAFGTLYDASPVLLYGFSKTIVKCFEYYLLERKKDIEIFICEARTKTQYRFNNRLIYSDGINYARELKIAENECNDKLEKKGIQSKVKIHIKLIPDSCASNLFSKKKIDKVLFGANGIDSAGNVGHTLGHLAIADMASKYNIPVYVIADSMKIGYFEKDIELQRGNSWLTTDIKFEHLIKEYKLYNPREDIVPPERIERVITEKGIFRPIEVKEFGENII